MRPSRVSLLLGTLAAGALSAQEPPALLQITVETIIAARQPELGDSSPWRIGELQFAAVAITPARHVPLPRIGTAFDEPEGSSRFTVIGAATRAEAEAAAASLGADALVFEVRPSWSKPANAWVAANPELWARR